MDKIHLIRCGVCQAFLLVENKSKHKIRPRLQAMLNKEELQADGDQVLVCELSYYAVQSWVRRYSEV